MKHVNYFKPKDTTHKTLYGRREQAWRWLRKMKRERSHTHNPKGLRADFIDAALNIGLFTRRRILKGSAWDKTVIRREGVVHMGDT